MNSNLKNSKNSGKLNNAKYNNLFHKETLFQRTSTCNFIKFNKAFPSKTENFCLIFSMTRRRCKFNKVYKHSEGKFLFIKQVR